MPSFKGESEAQKAVALRREEHVKLAKAIGHEYLDHLIEVRQEEFAHRWKWRGGGFLALSGLAAGFVVMPAGIAGSVGVAIATLMSSVLGYVGGKIGGRGFAAATETSKAQKRAQGITKLQKNNLNHIHAQIKMIEAGKAGDVADFILNAPLGNPDTIDIAYQKPRRSDASLLEGEIPFLRTVPPLSPEEYLQRLKNALQLQIDKAVKERGEICMKFQDASEACTWGAVLRDAFGRTRAEAILLNDNGPEEFMHELAEYLGERLERNAQDLLREIQSGWVAGKENSPRSQWFQKGKMQLITMDLSYEHLLEALLNELLEAGIGKFETEKLILNYNGLNRRTLFRLKKAICEEGAFPRLKKLSLRGNLLGSDLCKDDINAIKNHLHLREVDCSDNEIGEEIATTQLIPLIRTILHIRDGMPGQELRLDMHTVPTRKMQGKLYKAFRVQIAGAIERRSAIAITMPPFTQSTWGELLSYAGLEYDETFFLNNKALSEHTLSELAERLFNRQYVSQKKVVRENAIKRLKKQISQTWQRTRWEWATKGAIKLATINLSGMNVTNEDDDVSHFGLTPDLLEELLSGSLGKFDTGYLSLSYNALGKAGLFRLKNAILAGEAFSSLKKLDLSGNQLEGEDCLEAIKAIGRHVPLEELNLSDNHTLGSQMREGKIVSGSTRPLQEFLYALPEALPRLTYLDLRETGLCIEDRSKEVRSDRNQVTALVHVLQFSIFLQYIDLRENSRLGVKETSILLESVQKNPFFKGIFFDAKPEYAGIFAQLKASPIPQAHQLQETDYLPTKWHADLQAALAEHNITALILRERAFQSQHLRVLKECVVTYDQLRHLKKLDLSNNDLEGRECLENIQTIASHLPELKELDLSDNPRLGERPTFFQSFLIAISHEMAHLGHLHLRNVGLQGQAIFDLAETLGAAPLLERLDLRNNPALNPDEAALLEGITQNISLKNVLVDGEEAQIKINEVLEHHRQLFELLALTTVNKPQPRLLWLLNYKMRGIKIPSPLLDFLNPTHFYEKCLEALVRFIVQKRSQILSMDSRQEAPISEREYVACVQNKLSSFYQAVEERELSLEGKEIMRKNVLEGRAQLIALYWETLRRKNAAEAQQRQKNDNLMSFYEYNDEEPLSFVR